MTGRMHHEWPMDTYMTAWKLFRRLSDENRATAEHIISRARWPRQAGMQVLDLGCGDGHLLEQILLLNTEPIRSVVLVDPDAELLREAEGTIRATDLVEQVVTIRAGLDDAHVNKADAAAILLVHVVYLISPDTLAAALAAWPLNVPTYIVLDAPDSIFTTLWRRTAPKYHDRAVAAHELIANLSRDRFDVNMSTITSSITNPVTISRADVRDAILSILTYSEISSQTSPELRQWIEDTLEARSHGDVVRCESSCYELRRLA